MTKINAKDVKVGDRYLAVVGGKRTTVKITSIDKVKGYGPGRKTLTRYSALNESTGRQVGFKSAAKFQRRLEDDEKPELKPVKKPISLAPTPNEDERYETMPRMENLTKRLGGQYAPPVTAEGDSKPLPPIPSLASKLAELNEPVGVSTDLKPTDEQLSILDAVRSKSRVIVVEAGAGTGKTSTLKMIAQTLGGLGQYTAFNKSLVVESKEKFQGTKTSCDTTHALAFRSEGVRFAHRLNKGRVRSWQIAKTLDIKPLEIPMGEDNTKVLSPEFLAYQVTAAVRNFCQSADTEISEKHFKYLDGIDLPENGQRTHKNNRLLSKHLLSYAERYWDDVSDENGQLPFTHDHYVKVWQLNKPVIPADFILLDEAQDTAPVMLDVLQQQSCKIILVGDSAQQIYEWRGACNALAAFSEAPRCYLSQSFRFGSAIANVANLVLESLDEPTPLRLRGFDEIDSKVGEIAEPTAILCRTNAVAVSHLLGAMQKGRKPFLIGGTADVISFIEGAKKLQGGEPTSHPELSCFTGWKEVQEYVDMDEGEDLKLMVKIIDQFGCDTILNALKSMPEEKDSDLVISTAHKSKGRAWSRVKLAADFPPMSKCRDSDKRLVYVALTRARHELDITECPFFTGKDSLDLTRIVPLTAEQSAAVIPPAAPAVRQDGEFTWTKWDDEWHVRGPNGWAGETVTVVNKSGRKQSKRLVSVLKSFPNATIYEVER